MEIKSSFNQMITLDSGDEIIMSATESEFLTLALSSGGNAVKIAIDSTAAAKLVRGLSLFFSIQRDAKGG